MRTRSAAVERRAALPTPNAIQFQIVRDVVQRLPEDKRVVFLERVNASLNLARRVDDETLAKAVRPALQGLVQ